jgi:CBS-domain-containing membrane protein
VRPGQQARAARLRLGGNTNDEGMYPMIPTRKPLLSLTAGDLMSPATVVVPEEMSLQGAVRLLWQANVTGAPVVNADGRCVGVISATDLLPWVGKGQTPTRARSAASRCVCSDWQVGGAGDLPDEAVRHHMTADPVTTAVGASAGELARRMVDAHIHRVIVVDKDCKPVGVVSSTDLLAAIARADAAWRSAAGPEAEAGARHTTQAGPR